MTRWLLFLLMSVVCLVSAFADVAKKPRDWPVFRGDERQSGVAPSSLPDTLEVLWKFKTKEAVEGTAAIVNGVVYVGSFDEHLYAIDLETGNEKWKCKTGPIKVAPAARNGAVYVGNLDGVFYCVDVTTGKPRWQRDLEVEITSSVNFADDDILFGCGNEHLYCYSSDGTEKWRFKVPGGPVLGTPAVVGGRTFVTGCDSKMHVVDVKTGKETLAVELDGQTGTTPAVAGDHLYVGTMAKTVLAVDWKKGDVVWRYEPSKRANDFYASAAVSDKLVVTGSRDKRVHAIERDSGKEAWTFATKGHVDSSPVIAGSRIYVGSLDGNLYVLDLAKGTSVQTVKLGKEVSASPAVFDGRLVIGTHDGTVYCLGAKR